MVWSWRFRGEKEGGRFGRFHTAPWGIGQTSVRT